MSGAFFGREPLDAFTWMRANAPVYYDEPNDLWAAASYAAVKQASVDTESFSSAQGIRPKSPQLPMMIDFDAPEHVRRRRLVSEGFTPRRVRDLEGKLRVVCDALIDTVCEAGRCDFVRDLAAPLPIIMIGDMLGVAPEDRDDLLRWSDDMLKALGAPDPALMDNATTAFIEYTDYIHPVFDDRRAKHNTSDLVGVLCHAEIDGDSLDDDSLVHETLLILIGGDETTRHVISGGMEELLAHPDQASRLSADPGGLMPGAVEEMLRWVSPIKNMARTATRDVELAGAHIGAGQEILLLYPSANRDEGRLRERRRLRHHAPPQPAHGLRLRRALLPRQPAGAPGAARDGRTGAGPHARPPPGHRTGGAAAPGGQLHLRHRGDARRLHAERPPRSGVALTAAAIPTPRRRLFPPVRRLSAPAATGRHGADPGRPRRG